MTAPAWKVRAQGYLGTAEIAGHRNNPVVVGFWKSAHLGFTDDETPWCAGFVNAQLEESGIRGTRSAMAKSFLSWGEKLPVPIDGCIVVFHRPPNPNSGHVALFDKIVVRNGIRYVRVLGGNQGDRVSYALFRESSVAGYRWPKGAPHSVTPKASGTEDGEEDGINVSQVAALEPNENGGGLSPALTQGLAVTTSVGTAATPFLAYATDWRVVLAVFAGIAIVAAAGYFIYKRAGRS